MNKFFLAIFLLFVSLHSNGQHPALIQGLWENNTATGKTKSIDMAIDVDKNYIVAGYFNGTIDFDLTSAVANSKCQLQ
jgi:hypothetical protein